MTAVQNAEQEIKPNRSILAALALLAGLGMTLAIAIGMIGGMFHPWKAQVGLLIMASIPVCTIATGLAIASLIWRKENKSLAQSALWLNGMLAFFAFPIAISWLVIKG